MANAATDTEDFIANQLEAIDEQIDKINNSKIMRAAEQLIVQRTNLLSARRALLGAGSKTGGNAGTRVTQAEVVAWFEANPGEWSVPNIAESMHHSPEVIRGHLNRGKGERFKLVDGLWSLRDPEEGDE